MFEGPPCGGAFGLRTHGIRVVGSNYMRSFDTTTKLPLASKFDPSVSLSIESLANKRSSACWFDLPMRIWDVVGYFRDEKKSVLVVRYEKEMNLAQRCGVVSAY